MRDSKSEDVELSIVIPFYDEEKNVGIVTESLVSALKKAGICFEIILVNNGSNDGTDKEIDRAIKIFGPFVVKQVIKVNQGWGWGVISGLRICKGNYVGYMVGDGEINPHDVVKVYDLIKGQQEVLVKARRLIRNDGLIRIVLSWIYNNIVYLLYGLRIRDVNATPKIFNKNLLNTLDLESKRDFLDCELLAKVTTLGDEILEKTVIPPKRMVGRSHVNIKTICTLIIDVVSFKLKRRLSSWKKRLAHASG
jgi:glycosyltransferase involved in cell wall biosynthesis